MDESLEHHHGGAADLGSSGGGLAAAANFLAHFSYADTISRATSPGAPCSDNPDEKRYRPRTFSYFRLLPFDVEEESQRDAALSGILKNLYIAVKAEDFSPGATHWTRELQGWLNLKFEMTRELRAKLTKLYYHLSLAPGLDFNTADRFSKMVITLTRWVSSTSNAGPQGGCPAPFFFPAPALTFACPLQEEALPEAWRRSDPRLAAVMGRTQGVSATFRGSLTPVKPPEVFTAYFEARATRTVLL